MPIQIAEIGPTNPAAGVIATNPATAPLAAPKAVGLPLKIQSIAIQEMEDQAVEMGANVVLAVDLDYETIQVGSGGGMLMVSASGTAVSSHCFR